MVLPGLGAGESVHQHKIQEKETGMWENGDWVKSQGIKLGDIRWTQVGLGGLRGSSVPS